MRRLINVWCGFSVPQMRIFCLLTYPPRSIWASFEKMIFLSKSASSLSRSQAHLAKRKRIGWSIGFNSWIIWTLYCVIQRSLCKIRLNDVSEMFNCWERLWTDVDDAHFLPQQQYSWVYALFLAYHALVYRWGCQFLALFSQDNEHTKLTIIVFFQNPYATLAHILQYYHNFQSNIAIFPGVVQAYT